MTAVQKRIILAVGLGLVCASATYLWHARVSDHPSDFALIWWTARGWRSGLNPFEIAGPEPWRLFHFEYRMLYPLPAVLVGLPFSYLPLWLAETVFIGFSMAWLTWALTRNRLFPPQLWLFASTAMLSLVQTVQWSAFATAAALTPSMGWLLAVKPQTALPLLLAYPSRKAIVGCAVVGLLSVAFWPWWLSQWFSIVLANSAHMTPPILHPGGFVLALAALRWRRPEARLLLGLSCIPHTHARYDLLQLFLIVECWEEGLSLAILTALAYVLALEWVPQGADMNTMFALNARLMTWCIYLPCLAIVLKRPNIRADAATTQYPATANRLRALTSWRTNHAAFEVPRQGD